jgi:hypothetical protein
LALKFFPGQPGKSNVFAPSYLLCLHLTKFKGFGAWFGWWSFFEAEFEKDPHGPIAITCICKELNCYEI